MSIETANPLSSGVDDGLPRLLFMRHAQTPANLDGVFLGRRDMGVTELGAEQSKRAVAGLVAWKPERIFTSPLIRCREMIAEPAAQELGVECIVDPRITEFDFGPIEGMDFQEVMDTNMPFPWGPRAADWPPEDGGESFEAFGERLSSFIADVEKLEGRSAVICHGGAIRGFFSVLLNMSTDDINHLIVRNVDSFIFRMRPGFAELESYGIHPGDLASY